MFGPATLADLIDLLRRSRLVEGPRLEGVLAAARPGLTPEELLAELVADGILTPFQGDQLAQGRWKGFEVGGYRIIDRIGTGGMSQVYLAEHPARGTRVAVKVLAAWLADDPMARERFVREARAAAALTHPNIVRVVEVGTDAPLPFLVMEYIDGVSLQAAVARHGALPCGTAAYCARQAALGLQRAYEVGLVHRDVKPANLLVDRNGLVKLLDLGIVRSTVADDRLTLRMGQGERLILGTAEYLAPEQALNCSAVDTRADIYALGGTLYFLLAGHPPFPDGSPFDKVTRKLAIDPPPIGRLRPDVSPELAEAVHKMLARNPDDRFRTPLEAAVALTPFARPASGFPLGLFAKRTTAADEAGSATATPLPAPPPDGGPGPATAVVLLTPATAESDTELGPATVPTTPPHPPAPLRTAGFFRRWFGNLR
jgi:serine/threonine protein kinase